MAQVIFSRWNGDRLARRLPRRILTDFGPRISAQLQQEIATPQFPWPRTTRRENGRIVGSPRDIVDTGRLADSQTEPQIRETPVSVALEIEWTADYSGDVLRGLEGEGFISFQGQLVVGDQPGRDWISPALEKQDFAAFFAARWKELGSNQ